MKFTLVDDGHFRAAGLEGTLRGYYVTEQRGHAAGALPHRQEAARGDPVLEGVGVDRRHRQAAPARREGDAAITYGDDGEKFGVWPHTKEWVWDQGWLRDFLRTLVERQQQGSFKTEHFGEYLRSHRPTGRVYLPTASYEEMGEWTLPADAQQHYNEVRQRLKDRGELDGARAVLPRRHLAELPRQVSGGELPAQEDGAGLGQAGRAPRRSWRRGDGRARARPRPPRALPRAVQLRLLARPLRRALPQLPARRDLPPPHRGRDAGRARARHRRQDRWSSRPTSTPICRTR